MASWKESPLCWHADVDAGVRVEKRKWYSKRGNICRGRFERRRETQHTPAGPTGTHCQLSTRPTGTQNPRRRRGNFLVWPLISSYCSFIPVGKHPPTPARWEPRRGSRWHEADLEVHLRQQTQKCLWMNRLLTLALESLLAEAPVDTRSIRKMSFLEKL